MPEPPEKCRKISVNDGERSFRELPRRLIEAFRIAGIDSQGRQGRAILVRSESKPLRRRIRSYASARTAVTDSDLLFVGLAYVPADPVTLVPVEADLAEPVHLARLRKTLSDPGEALARTIVMAARTLAAIEQAVRGSGGSVEWILEGFDRPEIEKLLAIPADHRIVGMLAAFRAHGDDPIPISSIPPSVPIDSDGFAGGFPS